MLDAHKAAKAARVEGIVIPLLFAPEMAGVESEAVRAQIG